MRKGCSIWKKQQTRWSWQSMPCLRIPEVTRTANTEQRLMYLEEAIDEAKVLISGGDCGRAVAHAASFYADTMNLTDTHVGEWSTASISLFFYHSTFSQQCSMYFFARPITFYIFLNFILLVWNWVINQIISFDLWFW